VNARIYGAPIELQAPALQRSPDPLPPRSGGVSLVRLFNSLSLPKLLREMRVSNPSPRMRAAVIHRSRLHHHWDRTQYNTGHVRQTRV